MKGIALLTSIAFIGVIGCTDNQTADKTGQNPPVAPSDRAVQNAPNPSTGTPVASEPDHALAQRVEDTLRQDSTLAPAAQNVEVEANGGAVVLRGSVSNEQEKANIGKAAQQVAGVSRVDNQLEIASASR
jgi:osmotically-inducible protein OsmY